MSLATLLHELQNQGLMISVNFGTGMVMARGLAAAIDEAKADGYGRAIRDELPHNAEIDAYPEFLTLQPITRVILKI